VETLNPLAALPIGDWPERVHAAERLIRQTSLP